VGNSSVLTCSLKPKINMITWKIWPKVGGFCILGYRADANVTHTNCSNRINWKFRPDIDPALEIRQAGIDQEGNYTCEVVSEDGNFDNKYHLTVLVPPRLSLYCDGHGSPMCKAVAGKPLAQLSWVPERNFTAEEKCHNNGTVTVLSRFMACSTRVSNITNKTICMVSHPAGNWSQSIAC
ncbi:MOR1B protein, partial [Pardalotus punctatus]|nr:MOR1B protein [Pardalotus punctatus]